MNGLARADPAKQDADRVRFGAPPVDAPDELAPAQSLGAALGEELENARAASSSGMPHGVPR